MTHACPDCDGGNVRRLSTREADRTWRNTFYSRYRCRDCLSEFWVVRHRTYTGFITLLVAIALAIIGVFVMDKVLNPLNDGRSEDGIAIRRV